MLLQSLCSCSAEEIVVHAMYSGSIAETRTDFVSDGLDQDVDLIGISGDVLQTRILEDFTEDLYHRLIYCMIRGQLFRVS